MPLFGVLVITVVSAARTLRRRAMYHPLDLSPSYVCAAARRSFALIPPPPPCLSTMYQVSVTRTSSNAWCRDKCERLPGVKSATAKIEEVTGIDRNFYEAFQILEYGGGQFYRRHHDSQERDQGMAGPRILT